MDLVSKELKYFKNDLGVEYNYFWADTFLAMNKNEFEEFIEMNNLEEKFQIEDGQMIKLLKN